nr:ecto-NOX disulfide-thiol exchanger 2-like [Danaus plexippus plexippus]
MWLKMTEEVENIKEEFNSLFDEDESEKPAGKNSVTLEKYEQLKQENENLTYELEGYKNEAYLAKDEAERKFEKFKAHFIAQQALQNKQAYPYPNQFKTDLPSKPTVPLSSEGEKVTSSDSSIMSFEAKLISILTAFLLVHPLGASVDYLVSYVKSMTPNITQTQITSILQKFPDIFRCETSGVGACIEHRWIFVTFDKIKKEK